MKLLKKKKCFMGEKYEYIRPKIMLHTRGRNNISGPNVSNDIIFNSFLKGKYKFVYLVHDPPKGIINNLLVIRDLVAQIKVFNPDIVHVSGLLRSGFEAVVAARLCRKKVLLTIRGSSTDAIVFNKKILYSKLIEPLTMRLSHRVYAVCDAMTNRDYIKKHTKSRLIGTIHNCAPIINNETIVPFGLREKYGIKDDSIIVTIVGRMVFDKGITYVNEAIKRIQDKNIVFVFIGDGPIMEEIKFSLSQEIGEQRVKILGKQTNVISILKECDIFLFATLHENLSNALLEACSMSLAVIATNVGGNPEVIHDGVNGILIPPANSNAIVKAVTLLAGDKLLRENLGKNALKSTNINFSQTELLNKLEIVYNDLLSNKSKH